MSKLRSDKILLRLQKFEFEKVFTIRGKGFPKTHQENWNDNKQLVNKTEKVLFYLTLEGTGAKMVFKLCLVLGYGYK